MLKEGCDAFSRSYFKAHYQELADLDYGAMTKSEYLDLLEKLDGEVGMNNN